MDQVKIGIIADIHSELLALETALELLDTKGVETIVCAGDVVGKGFEGDEVVQIMRDRDIPCVMGNHDHFNYNWPDLQLAIIRTLKLETREYLQQLPTTLTFNWAGKSVLLAHGSPRNRNVFIHPFKSRRVFLEVIEQAQTDIVILGHTHEPMIVCVDEHWIFNPGSVCWLDSDGSGTCAVLTLPDCQFEVYRIRHGRPIEVSTND